jgi:hypothetical protein
MDVKAFCGSGKHPGGGPLAGPEAQLSEHSLPFPRELSKKAAVPLAEDPARDKLHSGNPARSEHGPLGRKNFANAQAGAGKTLEWAC